MCLSESCTSSASWCTVAYTVRRHSTWSTSDVASRQHLRSASRRLLVLPRHQLRTYTRRAFSVAGPSAWNSFPDNLRDSSVSRDSFCKLLKSYLFTRYWNIERIRGFTRMRYTNLLTYLLTYLDVRTCKVIRRNLFCSISTLEMPSLTTPVTQIGFSNNQTQISQLRVHCLNHWATAATFFNISILHNYIISLLFKTN